MFLPLKQGLAMVVVSTSLLSGQGLRIALAQSNDRVLNENLASDGLRAVPASLIREVDPYTRLSAYSLAGWDPAKRELWTKSLARNLSSVFRVQSPGDTLQREILIPTGVYDIYFEPQGRSLVYVKDTDGNEVFQLYAFDPSQYKSSLISDGKSRNTEPVWSNRGDRVILRIAVCREIDAFPNWRT